MTLILNTHTGEVISSPLQATEALDELNKDRIEFFWATDYCVAKGDFWAAQSPEYTEDVVRSEYDRYGSWREHPNSVAVIDLRDGTKDVYTTTPANAVLAAYAQSRNDWNTWDYWKRYGHLLMIGEKTVSCGDFSAFRGNTRYADLVYWFDTVERKLQLSNPEG